MLVKILSPSTLIDRFLSRPALPEQLCTSCGFVAKPVRRKKGHDMVEIALWLIFLVCAGLGVVSGALHYSTHFAFPGAIYRLFKFFAELFLVFGAVYTIWQLSTESPVCPKCERDSMIPPDSPKAQEIRRQHHD